jgi:uncharacterized membrane protein
MVNRRRVLRQVLTGLKSIRFGDVIALAEGSGQESTLHVFDPFVVVSALLGLFLFAPFVQAGLPQAPDGILHFYRAALWRWAWDDGVLWPRWHTLLYQGYGYPALSFSAPLLYALSALLSFITPSLPVALKGALLLACLAYAVGMYLWVRDILGIHAAIVASAAYTFATFRFRELYFLGGYAQFLAWSLYPWVLFFYHRLAIRPTRGRFVGAVLSLAGVIFSHNISAMLFAPVFVAYVLGLTVMYRDRSAWRRLLSATACALAATAIFWLPALGEMRYVRTYVLTQGECCGLQFVG